MNMAIVRRRSSQTSNSSSFTGTPRHRRSRLFSKQKLTITLITGLIILIIIGFFGSFLVFAWYGRDLPAPGKLAEAAGAGTVFYDRDGEVIYDFDKDKNRVPVKFDEIPDYLKKGTIAIEDKNFYKHKGISQTGIIRAVLSIVFRGSVQGGSTITQQLIKNVLLDSQRSLPRKVKEVILATEVEKRYTKDQILEMYLNEAPYGGSFWGVGSAARGYFDRDPKDLTLAQSAILAGLPQRPSYYSPYIGQNDTWKGRAHDVLRRMREDHYITREQEREAGLQVDKTKFSSPKFAFAATHFVFYVRDFIEREYGAGAFDKGLRIKTTLSLKAQKQAEKIVNEEVGKLKGYNASNGAAVVLDSKTGEILAMVGSYDFNDNKFGKFNAALGMRQPGSALKPITYATGFEKGYTPATMLMDVPTEFSQDTAHGYKPANYDGKFRGPTQVRFALGNSINVPAVKMLAMVGIRDFLQNAYDAGLTTLQPTTENINRFGLAITLGGGEVRLLDLTGAYSVFARGGTHIEPHGVTEIRDGQNKKIYSYKKTKENRVFTEGISFLISHILADNNARAGAFGAYSALVVPGRTVAVKTGTTDDKRDNWTLGYTNDVTVGVWVGNNDNSAMNARIASGVTGASPIWNRIMSTLLKDGKYKDGIAGKPSDVDALQIDSLFGGLPKDGYPTRSEYFVKGTEPKEVSPFFKKDGDKQYFAVRESDPISTDGKNRWQEAIDEWAKSQSDDRYKVPDSAAQHEAEGLTITISEPSNESTVNSNSVKVRAKIESGSKIQWVELVANEDNKLKRWEEDKHEIDETVNLPDGVYELKVVAKNEKGTQKDKRIRIGVNKPWQ